MTISEIIENIETVYKSTNSFIYETMFAHFANLSGFQIKPIHVKQGSTLIRARHNEKLEPFKFFNDVSYKKADTISSFGRINRPGQSMFYVSENEKTCFKEMLPFWLEKFATNDEFIVVLGDWYVRHDLRVILIPDPENVHIHNHDFFAGIIDEEQLFWKYISDKFKTSKSLDKNIYEFTSAFSNALILNAQKQGFKVDGLMYSSVQSPENINIALLPDVVDSENVIPRQFLTINFLHDGLDNDKKPQYKENEKKNRLRGLIDIDKRLIDWI